MKRSNVLMVSAIVLAMGSAFTPKLAKTSPNIHSYKLVGSGTCIVGDLTNVDCTSGGTDPCSYTDTPGNVSHAFSDQSCLAELKKTN